MKRMFVFSALVLAASGAMAQYRTLAETSTTAGAGTESGAHTYNTHGDVLANIVASFSLTQLNWNPELHTAELAYDGKYRLFGEQDTTASGGNESIIYTYNTYADLLNNNASSFAFTSINWNPDIKTVGFEYDGKYRLMGERDTSAGAGSESLIYTYDTFADVLSNTWSSFSLTNFNWDSAFHTAGIAYDGKYRLFGEQSTTASAGNESVIFTYDTFADFLSNNASSSSFTQRDLLSTYHTAGYTYEPVPEPATMAALGLGVAAMIRRRKNR